MSIKQKLNENQITYGNPQYKLTEVVFAKVKGFTDWPARITSKTNDRYGVTFFGDNTTYVFLLVYHQVLLSNENLRRFRSELPAKKLTKLGNYTDNFVMQKNQRNANFMAAWKEAVIAIEFSENYKPDGPTTKMFLDSENATPVRVVGFSGKCDARNSCQFTGSGNKNLFGN